MAKKQRLKVKRVQNGKKKGHLGFWEYVIFGVGGIAAILVAVWGGYFFSKQTTDQDIDPAVRKIISQIEREFDRGNLIEAEQIIMSALEKYKDDTNLLNQRALVLIQKGDLSEAEAIILTSITDKGLRRQGLELLRDAYRAKSQTENVFRMSKEIAGIE
ncbi:hypothetical protein JXQ70_17665 [bacterium]|nr:hypothetical protein [bacterium]